MTKTIKLIMPLFAFFIMLAGAKAEGDTVSTWQWQVQYGTTFWGLQYSKTDKYIVATGENDIYFLEPQNGKMISKIKSRLCKTTYDYGRVSFINEDKEFFYQSEDRKTIDCYDASTMQVKYSLEAVNGEIVDYDVSRDGKQIVANVDSNSLYIWDIQSRKITAHYESPVYKDQMDSWVEKPTFSPNGTNIIVNTYKKIKIGDSAYPPFYHAEEIRNCVIFNTKFDSINVMSSASMITVSKSGKFIAQLFYTITPHILTVKIYDALTYKELNTFEAGPVGGVANFFFTNDENHIVISMGSHVDICKVFRIKDGVNTINYVTGSAHGAALSNSGNSISFANQGYITQYNFSPIALIENSYFNNGFISYPNPIQGGGILKFNQEKPGKTKIYISNEKGSVLKEVCNTYFDAGQQAVAIDASDLANGIYFITVLNDTQKFTEKIIVNR